MQRFLENQYQIILNKTVVIIADVVVAFDLKYKHFVCNFAYLNTKMCTNPPAHR